jgi:hypothetical protein
MSLRDDFDGVINHFDSGLIVNRVRRNWKLRCPFFRVYHGSIWMIFVIKVWNQRKIN